MHEDPDIAEDFIAKLTKVYRYVLDVRDEVLVGLTEELNFLKSYFFLQKIRFGSNLRLKFDIPPKVFAYHIPPLTLQLLVENAIKHNIISRQQPLTIELLVENDTFFVVKNNYQKRTDAVASTGIGIPNLQARYGFLSEIKPVFYLENDHYIAKVPLIKEA